MSLRSELRRIPFTPRFAWVSTVAGAADAINQPHEDYPMRVPATQREIERLSGLRLPATIAGALTLEVHRAVFADTDFAGRWKDTDIFLGPDGKPVVTRVADLMTRLETEYSGKALDVQALVDWYIDFQTVHPFPDGNGRTGGVIVAAYCTRRGAG
jgi:fido (protein-threonine AMPylation protein)